MGPPEPEQGTIVVKQETATPHKDKCEEGTPTKDGAGGSPQAPRIRMKVSPKAVAKAKAKARAKANAQSQPAEGHYEAPDREAWKDVRYQLQKLEKAGKGSSLRKGWQNVQGQGQMAKRKWYYEVFMLDPEVSKKACHKTSLQEKGAESSLQKGWVTKYVVGKMEGANPNSPDFEELCDAAVTSLESKDHWNPLWAQKGVKLYWYEKRMMDVEKEKSSSSTQVKQEVELDTPTFQHVEGLLAYQPPEAERLKLGQRPDPDPPRGHEGPPPAGEPDPCEAYKMALKSLKKAISALSTSLDKGSVLKEAIAQKQNDSDPHVKAHMDSLKQGLVEYGKKKQEWLKRLGTFSQQVDPADAPGSLEEVNKVKAACEEDLKSLNKAWGPAKLWAKNEGI